MFGRLGPIELLLILAVALVIFGPKKLPEIGSAVGKAIQGFRDGLRKPADDGHEGSSGDDAARGRKPGQS